MKDNIIEVRNLRKNFKVLNRKSFFRDLVSRDYKTVRALDGISLEIKKGEFVGIIGPNGAGKSTLIKVLTGILTPDAGKVMVNNYVPYLQREKYTQNIGAVFGQRTQLWWDLPVEDSFQLAKTIYKIPDDVYKRNLERFSNILGIREYFQIPVRRLSLGQRMRCDIASSLLHDPTIIFLDEPTIGLDVEAKHSIRDFLRELNKSGVTVILTTHDMDDIEELCQRILIINNGRKIYDGDIEKVRHMFGKEKILTFDFLDYGDDDSYEWVGVKLLEKKDNMVKLLVDSKRTSVSKVIKRILARRSVDDISIEEPQIEDVIRKIYKKGVKCT
jgi:ABC-2 type transport system ATP-binding protein